MNKPQTIGNYYISETSRQRSQGHQSDGPACHFDDLMQRIGGNLDLVKQLLSVFTASSLEYLQQIDSAIAHADANALTISAHSLKGAAANLGGVRAAEYCRQLEIAAREGNLRDAGTLQRRVMFEVAALQAELHQLVEEQTPAGPQPSTEHSQPASAALSTAR